MQLKTLAERSGFKTILWAFLAWFAASLPQWIEAIQLAAPWGGIAAAGAAFVAATIRLLMAYYHEPSVEAVALGLSQVATMPKADRATVAKAQVRKADAGT